MTDGAVGGEYLARSISQPPRSAAAERIREHGSEVVQILYRLVKIGLMHDAENDAVGQLLDQTVAVFHEFAGLAGGPVVLTFAENTVLVSGQLLWASRSVFESAAELGALLERCGVSEVRADPKVTRADLKTATQALVAAIRDGTPSQLTEFPISTVTFLKYDALVNSSAMRRKPGERQSLGYYASALVTMRRFFDDVAAGKAVVPHRVKRIGQGLVGLAETEGPGLLGLTTLANAHRDDAGRALQSAILAIAIAREMTHERPVVARIALAALLADAGRVKLGGVAGRDRLVPLDDSVDREVPAMTAALSLGGAGMTAHAALHTVVVYEATQLERQADKGPLYEEGTEPLLHSKILQVARAMLDLLAPRTNVRGVAVHEALEALGRHPSLDRTVLRLLVKAVGLLPIGSVVEMETSDWAVVIGPSRNTETPDRPIVRIVMDRQGVVREPPLELDLGMPPDGVTYPRIARVLSRDETRFNVTAALT